MVAKGGSTVFLASSGSADFARAYNTASYAGYRKGGVKVQVINLVTSDRQLFEALSKCQLSAAISG